MSHACYVCNFEPVPDGDGAECPHCHRLQYGSVCARCGQPAPTIVRSFRVYCTACGSERGPLALVDGKPINLIGTTSRLGGKVARWLGWFAIVGGILAALVFGGIGFSLLGAGAFATIIAWLAMGAGLAGVIAAGAGTAMVLGGRRLGEHGDKALDHARESAIQALAANRGGLLTATDVSTALNIQHSDADAILTRMAKEGTRVGVEVDAQGVVNYVFKEVRALRAANSSGVRVDTASTGDGTTTPKTPEENAKEKVDREFDQMRRLRQGPS